MKYAEEHPSGSEPILLGNTSSDQRWYVGDDAVAYYFVIRSITQSKRGVQFVAKEGTVDHPYIEYNDGYVQIKGCVYTWGYLNDANNPVGSTITYNCDVYVVK